jgi:beta-glucosidase
MVKALSLSAQVDSNFKDVDSSAYYYEAVGIAKKLGITQGKTENLFDPEAEITRQEMMTIAVRAMEAAKKNLVPGTEMDLSGFADKSEVASYALTSVATLIKNGIIAGNGTSIQPLKYATRAETAVMIYRIYNH